MAFFLLGWHGGLVGYTGWHLQTASFADILSGAVSPVIMHDDGTLEPCGAFITPTPLENSDSTHAFALKINRRFASDRRDGNLELVDHCVTWESFIPVQTAFLPILKDLTTRSWHEADKWVGKAHCTEHHLHIGDRHWSIGTLNAEKSGETITLWNTDAPDRVTYKLCPSRALSSLLETLNERLQAGEIRSSVTTPWADSGTLRENLANTCFAPHRTDYLLHLSRQCALFEIWDLATGFLACARQQDSNPDFIYFAAILALRAQQHDSAAQLLAEALTTRFPDSNILEKTATLRTRLAQGENTLLLLPQTLEEAKVPMFDRLFDLLMVPLPLSTQDGKDIQQAYSMRFEDMSCQHDMTHRLKLLTAEAHYNGISYWEEVNMGHVAWLAGLRTEADAHYASARKLAIESHIHPIHYNCGVFSWLSEADCTALSSRSIPDRLGVSQWEWQFSPEDDATALPSEVCLVFGCDKGYFRFIPKLILSLIRASRANPTTGFIQLCIGVDQPTMEQLTFLTKTAEWLVANNSRVRLNFAHGILTYRDGATYTAIRYLMLPEITARFSCPLITADCDGYFPSDFVSLWQDMKASADYGFRLYAYNREGKQVMGEPWGFGAGISYFGDADRIPAIAHFLSDYLNTAYNPQNPTNWCVDQCALAAAFKRFVAPKWDELRIKFMDEGTPLMVMPHHVGGKDALLAHEGSFSMVDVVSELARYTPEPPLTPPS